MDSACADATFNRHSSHLPLTLPLNARCLRHLALAGGSKRLHEGASAGVRTVILVHPVDTCFLYSIMFKFLLHAPNASGNQ